MKMVTFEITVKKINFNLVETIEEKQVVNNNLIVFKTRSFLN